MTDYYLIETKDLYDENSVGGGLGKSGDPRQRKIVYVRVNSVDENSANTERLGGKVIQPKMTIPGWGYLATCLDTEGNVFGLWQADKEANLP